MAIGAAQLQSMAAAWRCWLPPQGSMQQGVSESLLNNHIDSQAPPSLFEARDLPLPFRQEMWKIDLKPF